MKLPILLLASVCCLPFQSLTAQEATTTPGDSAPPQDNQIHPGWRPSEAVGIPRNPFISDVTAQVVSNFQEVFKSLASDIIGVVYEGKRAGIIMSKQVIWEGEYVDYSPGGKSNSGSNSSRLSMASSASSTASDAVHYELIFRGINKTTNEANFSFKDSTFPVALPSPAERLAENHGMIDSIDAIGTATIVSSDGWFVIDSGLIPKSDPNPTILVKTSEGTFAASIERVFPELGIAIGHPKANPNAKYGPIFPTPEWGVADKTMAEAVGVILAYDPQESEHVTSPRVWKLTSEGTNPRWLIGAGVFVDKKCVGILTLKNDKIQIMTKNELANLTPELHQALQASGESPSPIGPHATANYQPIVEDGSEEAKAPTSKWTSTITGHPEQMVGMLQLYTKK